MSLRAVRRSACSWWAWVVVACSVGLVIAPAAAADGDPASDVLLYQQVYLPYGQVLPVRLSDNVQQVAANANAASFPVRLAVIASEDDLGAAVAMFGHPQQYARFLYKELAAGPSKYRTHVPAAVKARQGAGARAAAQAALLVVMPNGYGVAGPVSSRAQHVVEGTALNTTDGLSLGQAAVDGVAKLASDSGRRISVPANPLTEDQGSPTPSGVSTPPASRSRTSQGGGPWIGLGIAAAAIAVACGSLVLLRRRRART